MPFSRIPWFSGILPAAGQVASIGKIPLPNTACLLTSCRRSIIIVSNITQQHYGFWENSEVCGCCLNPERCQCDVTFMWHHHVACSTPHSHKVPPLPSPACQSNLSTLKVFDLKFFSQWIDCRSVISFNSRYWSSLTRLLKTLDSLTCRTASSAMLHYVSIHHHLSKVFWGCRSANG